MAEAGEEAPVALTLPQAVYDACLDELALGGGVAGVPAGQLWVAAGEALRVDVAHDGPLTRYVGAWLARTPDVRVEDAAASSPSSSTAASATAEPRYFASERLRAKALGLEPGRAVRDNYRAVLEIVARACVRLRLRLRLLVCAAL